MKQASFDFNFTGEQLSQAGQELAISHANAVCEGWAEKAYQLLSEYVACYGSTPFTSESFRDYCEIAGLPEPPTNRAFGHIFTRAKRSELIKSVGLTKTIKRSAHGCFSTLWVRA